VRGVAVLNLLLCIESCIYREGLRSLLAARPDVARVEVCSQASEIAGASDAPADLVLIDVALGVSAAAASAAVTAAHRAAGAPVIALGLAENDEEVLGLMEAGAAAFITKDNSIEDLVETMLAVARGEPRCAPRMVWLMQQRLVTLAAGRERDYALAKLSHREHHILGLVKQRLSNKQIARTLGLEVSTIKNHVHNIIVKLSVKNRAEAAAALGGISHTPN
jgi:DNA-binding NarL/FixJ family response regulator